MLATELVHEAQAHSRQESCVLTSIHTAFMSWKVATCWTSSICWLSPSLALLFLTSRRCQEDKEARVTKMCSGVSACSEVQPRSLPKWLRSPSHHCRRSGEADHGGRTARSQHSQLDHAVLDRVWMGFIRKSRCRSKNTEHSRHQGLKQASHRTTNTQILT